jgi:hypothetical protein
VWKIAAEALAALCATALAALLLAHLTASPRVWLLLYDGDSVLPALIAGSVRAEQGADWALSAVAFIPESAVYLALAALGLSTQATLALNAVTNLLALYVALRLVAGAALRPAADAALGPAVNAAPRPEAGAAPPGLALGRPALALTAFAVFIGFGLLESSASRETLELATLLATTTYYSAAVIGTVLGLALLVRVLAPAREEARPERGARAAAVLLTVITALSVMSNPIVGLWFVAPLLALTAGALATGLASRPRVAAAALALVAGSTIGAVLRLPLGGLLTEGPGDKLRPGAFAASARYYADLLAQRWVDGGWPVVLAVAVLLALGTTATIAAVRARRLGPALVATASWLIPLASVLGAVVLGTQSPRYLQPVLFAPVLAVLALPVLVDTVLARNRRASARTRRMPAGRRAGRLASAAAAVVLTALVALGGISAVTGARQLDAVDASVGCVVDWVEASARTGVGTFWTVRAPKAYLADPRRLVQVDAQLNGYAWLVNREDFVADRASFVVVSDEGGPVAVPSGLPKPERVDCGRYTILDYGRAVLEIGPARS